MTLSDRLLRERLTGSSGYDDGMAHLRPCPCGRHMVSGQWSRLYCPWAPKHQGLHAQPDSQDGIE